MLIKKFDTYRQGLNKEYYDTLIISILLVCEQESLNSKYITTIALLGNAISEIFPSPYI